MPVSVDRKQVQRLLERGAQLVEVLPQRMYDVEHLPGAISIPLKDLDASTAERLDPDEPVIAYCYDYT